MPIMCKFETNYLSKWWVLAGHYSRLLSIQYIFAAKHQKNQQIVTYKMMSHFLFIQELGAHLYFI